MSEINQQPVQLPLNQKSVIQGKFSNKQIDMFVFFLTVLLISGYFLRDYILNPAGKLKTAPKQEIGQTGNSKTIPKVKYYSFENIRQNDTVTSLYFADANNIFRQKLDGSPVEFVTALPSNISSIDQLKNSSLLIFIDNSQYQKTKNADNGMTYYEQKVKDYKYWLLPANSTEPQQIDEQKYFDLIGVKGNCLVEKIYTKTNAKGYADILTDELNGKPPQKIGELKEKPVPGEFYPSFDGSYLLNKSPGGGGLGMPGIVLSRDGTRIYKINFHWYGGAAVWLSSNELLAHNDMITKIIRFKPDGNLEETALKENLNDFFEQKMLSPDSRYLIINKGSEFNLFDIDNKAIQAIEAFDSLRFKKENKLSYKYNVNQEYTFIGWNGKSDKILYKVYTRASSGDANDPPISFSDIKIFDVKQQESYVILKLDVSASQAEDGSREFKADVARLVIR